MSDVLPPIFYARSKLLDALRVEIGPAAAPRLVHAIEELARRAARDELARRAARDEFAQLREQLLLSLVDEAAR